MKRNDLLRILTKLGKEKKNIPISNFYIEDRGERNNIESLTIDDKDVGLSVKNNVWFYPLVELTQKELQALYDKLNVETILF